MGVFEQLEEIRNTITPPRVVVGTSETAKPNTPTSDETNVSITPSNANEPSLTLSPTTLSTPSPTSVEAPPARAPERPIGRSPVRRTFTRHSFELYQDQIDTLRRLALEEKLLDGKGNMSEMARDALDAYLAKRKRTQG